MKACGAVIAITLLVASFSLLLIACGGSATSGGDASIGAGTNSSLNRIALEVPTIWCSTCKPRVEASARGVPGVKNVEFDEERMQIVVVTYDTSQTTPQAIVKAIERGGDKVTRVVKS